MKCRQIRQGSKRRWLGPTLVTIGITLASAIAGAPPAHAAISDCYNKPAYGCWWSGANGTGDRYQIPITGGNKWCSINDLGTIGWNDRITSIYNNTRHDMYFFIRGGRVGDYYTLKGGHSVSDLNSTFDNKISSVVWYCESSV